MVIVASSWSKAASSVSTERNHPSLGFDNFFVYQQLTSMHFIRSCINCISRFPSFIFMHLIPAVFFNFSEDIFLTMSVMIHISFKQGFSL